MNQFLAQINMKSICLVHDWLVAMRGGEKVLENLAELFPEAPIYTLFATRKNLSPRLKERAIHTSFLQWIPGIDKFYRWLLPIFPLAIRSLNVKKYDLVISSSHCVAKAVQTRKDATHICYCHTPMRYLWGFEEEYFGNFPKWLRYLIRACFGFLKKWDIETSRSVTAFIANSENTAEKIRNLYGKEAYIIHPPIELLYGTKNSSEYKNDNYFLIVSALVPYKRIDLAIETFNKLALPLKIVGDGPLRSKLSQQIRFKGIQLEGWANEETLQKYYAECKALLMPGEEDFGIVPLEAQMFGKPVIAFGKGGVLETVLALNAKNVHRSVQESTGLFFYEQNSESLGKAIQKFESLEFNPSFIKSHALQFGADQFQRKFMNFLNETYPVDRSRRSG